MSDRFSYTIDENCNVIIEESQNQFTALRRISWGSSDENPEARLELRRWRNQPDGSEFPLKGCTFMTEEGPSNLAEALLDLGYGNTLTCLKSLLARDNARKYLNSALNNKDDEFYDADAGEYEDETEEYYDPKSLLNL